MTCGGCVSKITRALKSLAGVDDVNISLSAGEATVHYDDSVTSLVQLRSAVTGAGYGAGESDEVPPTSKGGCCS